MTDFAAIDFFEEYDIAKNSYTGKELYLVMKLIIGRVTSLFFVRNWSTISATTVLPSVMSAGKRMWRGWNLSVDL